ncbi:MAG TPA: hypothetical protein VGS22_04100 [Thermoanaerobaculia bacterium]|nr:hypothetical protein [Thermoanaerobaculia bacterium]
MQFLACHLCFLLLVGTGSPLWAAPEPPLTNSDIINLCKAGLSDDIIIAKIRQTSVVNFQLDTDSILALSKQGVSNQVVKAMLDKVTPPSQPNSMPPSFIPGGFKQNRGVSLSAKEGELALTLRYGDITATGFSFVQIRYLNISGLRSPVRTADPGASLLVHSDIDPSTSDQFQLVRLEIDSDDKIRSMKLGKGSAFRGGMRDYLAADKDIVLAFTTEPAGPDTFRIKPSTPFTPGEYGVLTGGISLYDFGVD